MLHIGAAHSNNGQIILRLFGSDIFSNNLQHKNNFKQIWRYQRYVTNRGKAKVMRYQSYVTNRGKAKVMLHIGAGHSNNCQIIVKLFGYDIFFNNLQHKTISCKFGGINDLLYK